jgi:hypothetical protein
VHLSLEQPSPEFVRDLVGNARCEDQLGAEVSGVKLSTEWLAERAQMSNTIMHAYLDDVPAAVWGVVVNHPVTGTGDLWFVGSRVLEEHWRTFVRVSRFVVGEILMRRHPKLRIGVDDWYRESLRWVQWMGFQPQGTVQWNGGGLVHVMTKEA